MAEPLYGEYHSSMNGIVRNVAEYHDYPNAIGYSYRYFTTDMMAGAPVKLLCVNGIAPSAENIRSGAYPFTVDEYLVTTKDPSPNTQAMVDWILSPEGQAFVERCGRVPQK